ncbi:MAG: glycosyltransferase family 39 protein [bacterium]|nr:glycosyltransferase family 39 protein [bacterium]
MSLLKIKTEFTFIVLLLFAGGFLRFYNLNWDSGHYFHPDERNIASTVSRIHFFDNLDPQFFAYGGLTIYLYRVSGDLLVKFTHNPAWVSDWGQINQLGRFFSALFSTLTIIPLYLLAKKSFNKETALLSALVFTFAAGSIQTAHFDTTEGILALLAVSLALFSIDFLGKPGIKNIVWAAGILGLSAAAKTTAASYIIFPLTAFLFFILSKKKFLQAGFFLLILFILGAVVFTILSPYTFLSWDKFLESMRYESGVATGSLAVPYTLQFDHTIPYLFQLQNLLWQIGPLALFIIPGILLTIWEGVRKRDLKLIVLLSFPLVYFAYVGTWHTKFIRYMMPVIPFFIIFASFFLYRFAQALHHSAHQVHQLPHLLVYFLRVISSTWKVMIVVLITLSILWGLAIFSIYTREQTRISASLWIYSHIREGSIIYNEHWDDGLPLPLKNLDPNLYQTESLTIYDADNGEKLDYYAQKLSSGDYIILGSRRLYGTLINLSEKYPLTSKYYQLLFSGQLGYQKVAEFSSYPSLLGWEVNDDLSEETFQVYDHPKVIIFKNTSRLTADDYLQILGND